MSVDISIVILCHILNPCQPNCEVKHYYFRGTLTTLKFSNSILGINALSSNQVKPTCAYFSVKKKNYFSQ